MRLEFVRGDVKYSVEILRGGNILINRDSFSYEEGVERLIKLGVLYRSLRGSGRFYCTTCRLGYPVDVWNGILRCPFCRRLLRTHPHTPSWVNSSSRVQVSDEL
jgi:uncharacterized protein YbaR (Trm112 family)